ncbi:MAG: endonuclease III domain-containing protein [Planctomycetota bacterium]
MAGPARNEVMHIYELLLEAFGPQHWWPARTRQEIVIGAILTQNTAWSNVERAIAALRRADCLSLQRIHETPLARLAELVRSSGTHRVKARRLKALAEWLHSRFGGSLNALFALGTEQARRELLIVKGVGPETADAILLYAGNLPIFVVDAYTHRILRRHFLLDWPDDYERTRALLERAIPPHEGVYGEYHALLVELGKRCCRKRAQCGGCPLESLSHDANL